MNKGEFQKVQHKIVEVSAALRESNQALCRNLKENPNAQGNLIKMLQERARIHTLLEDAKKELQKPVGEQGFAGLVSKAELERKDQVLTLLGQN